MIFYIIFLLIFRNLIKIFFINYDYHSLFRSFFCLSISALSICTSIYNWNNLIINPLGSNKISNQINKLMLTYMLFDLVYFAYKNNYRIELVIHHILCFIIFLFFSDSCILTFCSINEILSAFNWIGILFPKYEWANKLFRLFSIIFIRLFIWLYTLSFLQNSDTYFNIGLFIISIFILLDIYWTFIILYNYFKYKTFIKDNLIKKKIKLIKNIKKNIKKKIM